jgi:hypothetical protein
MVAARQLPVSALPVVLLALFGCGSGGGGMIPTLDGGGPDEFDMSGTWTLTLNPPDPPWTVECSGGLEGRVFTFCGSFTLTLAQNGIYFAPENGQGETFCDSTFSITGSSTPQEITGVITRRHTISSSPLELEIQEMAFRAGIIGDSGTFALVEITVDTAAGECLLGGSYRGVRHPTE